MILIFYIIRILIYTWPYWMSQEQYSDKKGFSPTWSCAPWPMAFPLSPVTLSTKVPSIHGIRAIWTWGKGNTRGYRRCDLRHAPRVRNPHYETGQPGARHTEGTKTASLPPKENRAVPNKRGEVQKSYFHQSASTFHINAQYLL
jgi:hypothetical protein